MSGSKRLVALTIEEYGKRRFLVVGYFRSLKCKRDQIVVVLERPPSVRTPTLAEIELEMRFKKKVLKELQAEVVDLTDDLGDLHRATQEAKRQERRRLKT